jgi:hypothetical protein
MPKKKEDGEETVPSVSKRGRKPKKVVEEAEGVFEKVEDVVEKQEPKEPKKRGRKPKGGKIVQQVFPLFSVKETKSNVILHLKCSLRDITGANTSLGNVEPYSFDNGSFGYEAMILTEPKAVVQEREREREREREERNEETVEIADYQQNRDIWRKLKALEQDLHLNNVSNKKSCCFFDTCEFDNPPIYIPKCFMKGSYQVYGCFCSPECATAYLMNESIDTSTKFERYHLINHIYGKAYNYNRNIKPAPNPYYTLDKFYGSLSIQEYRSLLSNGRLFLVMDKPMTRVMPELHEDNDDYIIVNKVIPSSSYKVKKKVPGTTKSGVKNTIVNEKFGNGMSASA